MASRSVTYDQQICYDCYWSVNFSDDLPFEDEVLQVHNRFRQSPGGATYSAYFLSSASNSSFYSQNGVTVLPQEGEQIALDSEFEGTEIQLSERPRFIALEIEPLSSGRYVGWIELDHPSSNSVSIVDYCFYRIR